MNQKTNVFALVKNKIKSSKPLLIIGVGLIIKEGFIPVLSVTLKSLIQKREEAWLFPWRP